MNFSCAQGRCATRLRYAPTEVAELIQHAQSSAKKFGGRAEDYLAVHNWLDESRLSSPISDVAQFGTRPKASSYASASSVSRSPTAKVCRSRYVTSENST
jgi:hypothetical protein